MKKPHTKIKLSQCSVINQSMSNAATETNNEIAHLLIIEGATILSMMTLSTATFSITTIKRNNHHNDTQHNSRVLVCCYKLALYAECLC